MAQLFSAPGLLQPFDPREAISIPEAAALAGVSLRAMRDWCVKHEIGRSIAGRWRVSRVALRALLDGDQEGLAAYQAGDRSGPAAVRAFKAAGVPLPAPEALAA